MALRISFKPGVKQSQQAAQYYLGAVGSLVETMIHELDESTYMISSEVGPSLQLRTWCAEPLAEGDLHELFDWLISLRTDIQGMQQEALDQGQLAELVRNWLAVRMGGANIFVELSIVHPETGVEEQPEFSVALVRGRSVMISTDALLFTWLDKDMFGLTLAGHGSYLLELVEEELALRKAS